MINKATQLFQSLKCLRLQFNHKIPFFLYFPSILFGLLGTKDKVSAAAYEKVKNLCSLCAGTGDDKCSTNSSVNEYVSHKGAFKCMKDGRGDVAFVKRQVDSPADFYDEDNKNDYQFLCKNGGRMGNVYINED